MPAYQITITTKDKILVFMINEQNIKSTLITLGGILFPSTKTTLTNPLHEFLYALKTQYRNIIDYEAISYLGESFSSSYEKSHKVFNPKETCAIVIFSRQQDNAINWKEKNGFIGSLAKHIKEGIKENKSDQYAAYYEIGSIERRGNKVIQKLTNAPEPAVTLKNNFNEENIDQNVIAGIRNCLRYIVQEVTQNKKVINFKFTAADLGAMEAVSIVSFLQLLLKAKQEYNTISTDLEKNNYLQKELGLE